MENQQAQGESLEAVKERLRNEAIQADEAPTHPQPPQEREKPADDKSQQPAADRAAEGDGAQRNLNPESSSEPKKTQMERDAATGKFVKKAQTPEQNQPQGGQQPPAQPQQKQEQTPEPSEYQKKRQEERERRDAERLEKNWQKNNERSAQNLQKERELREWEERLRRMPDPTTQPRMDSQQLKMAADDFKSKARAARKAQDYEQADELDKLAEETYTAAHETYQYEQYQHQQLSLEQHKQAWAAHTAKVCEDIPELNNPESEISQRVAEMIGNDPRFSTEVDGFEIAVALAQGHMATEENSGLKAELAEKDKEITRLNQLLSPLGRTGTSGHAAQGDPLSGMSIDERRRVLREQAEVA